MSESAINWTLLGDRPHAPRPRPNWTSAVLAILLAYQTFIEVPPTYPIFMTVVVILDAAWALLDGVKKRALISLLFVPVIVIWLLPVFGLTYFNQMSPIYFGLHSLAAILFATAAYGYQATERR